jgi:DNA-binding NarL/FixJ family response regulator
VSFHPSQTPASGASGVWEIPAAAGNDVDPAQAATIRLVTVEDDEGLLDPLSRILAMQPDISVVGSYVSTEEAMESTEWLAVDVMLVDLGLPGVSGVDLIATATFKNPRLHTLVHTIHNDRDSLFAALRAGAVGYLIKGMPAPETLEAVRAVAIGTPSLSPSVAPFLIDEFRGRSTANPEETLSAREVELLHLSAQGLSSRKSASGSRSAPAPCTATSSGSTASCRSAAASRRCAAPRPSATSTLRPASARPKRRMRDDSGPGRSGDRLSCQTSPPARFTTRRKSVRHVRHIIGTFRPKSLDPAGSLLEPCGRHHAVGESRLRGSR